MNDFLPCTTGAHDKAFIYIEFHFPCEFPFSYGVEIILEEDGIVYVPDGAVNNTVVCKETSRTVHHSIRKVVDISRRKRIGPKTVPWGTPDMTLLGPDAAVSSLLAAAF